MEVKRGEKGNIVKAYKSHVSYKAHLSVHKCSTFLS